jgi:hypothetical protein
MAILSTETGQIQIETRPEPAFGGQYKDVRRAVVTSNKGVLGTFAIKPQDQRFIQQPGEPPLIGTVTRILGVPILRGVHQAPVAGARSRSIG